MLRTPVLATLAAVLMASASPGADALRGTYVEARTCQVYTGPCFANGEVGSTGKDAIMTWNVESGQFDGTDLSGLSVALIVKTSDTLGFNGLDDARSTKAMLIVDKAADADQSAALRAFAMARARISDDQLSGTHRANFETDFDKARLTANVRVGEFAYLQTRKARPGDCICSNESAYYPPLTELEGFVPGVTIDGEVTARDLGTRWAIPDSRTAYLGTFRFESQDAALARKI